MVSHIWKHNGIWFPFCIVSRSCQAHEIRRTLPDDHKCRMFVSWYFVLLALNLTAVVYMERSLEKGKWSNSRQVCCDYAIMEHMLLLQILKKEWISTQHLNLYLNLPWSRNCCCGWAASSFLLFGYLYNVRLQLPQWPTCIVGSRDYCYAPLRVSSFSFSGAKMCGNDYRCL